VTRSELDFLESTVLASQIKRLMFVLNFADRLEPHERDAGATLARRRVASVLGECDFPVFLVSAADGSGIPLLRDALTAIQSCGPQSDEKIQRLSGRLDGLIDALLADLSKADKAATLDDNALRQQYEELQARWKAREERIAKIADWTRERESELLAMVRKSLYTFVDGLREDVEDDVSSYNGPDFKGFVETQIPLLIKKRCKNWIESHSDAMRQLLKRLSDSLTEALNNEFATRISPLQPQATRQLGSEYRYSDLKSADASDGRLKAGLLVGGAGALMFALGASMLYPLVTLAAYPLLSKELEKHGLRTAKQAFLPELHRALDNVSTHFTADVLVSLQTEIHGLQIAAEEKYRDLLQGEVRQVEHEQIGRQECVALVRNRRSELREVMGKLTEYKQRLARINESEEGAYE
jgi:DNA-directed RNA polymerase subunit F